MGERPANSEMIEGYRDGRKQESPEPLSNRSRSYRHGFLAGRGDLNRNAHSFTADEMRKMADEAMDADAERVFP